jgi:hypothetical protein
MRRKIGPVAVCLLVLTLAGCSSLTLEKVEFGWPVESVLTVSDKSTIEDNRYALGCTVAPLAYKEFGDSTALRGSELRVLRNNEGFYFITGRKFKNVYVFAPGAGELSMRSAIEISAQGLSDPALNQRPPYVELLDGKNLRKMLSKDEIVQEPKK